jgi:PAS domain S-box-containing protein
LGVIAVHDDEEGRNFEPEELNILFPFGTLAAVVLENAYQTGELDNQLIDSAFDAIVALDRRGRIIKFNRQAENILGYKAQEVMGQSVRCLYAQQEDAQDVMARLKNSQCGRATDIETTFKSKDGEKVDVLLSAAMLLNHKREEIGTVGFFRDRREYQAGIAITRSLELDEIFATIVQQASHLTRASQSSHLSLRNGNTLEVKAAYPPEQLAKLQRTINIDLNNPIGVTGRAFKEGAAQLVGDVMQDPDYFGYDPETRSELAVPIKANGQIIGVIDVEDALYDAFNGQDQQTLETLAGYAAVAIQNAQHYAQSETEKKRFEMVAEIIRKAATSLEINELLRTVCHRLEKVFAAKQAIASLRLYDDKEQVLTLLPSWHETFHKMIDIKAEKGRTSQRLDEGICGWVATHRRSRNERNVNEASDYLRLISKTQSEMSVPICEGKERELVGVLDLQSPELYAFDDSDQKLLETLADQLAIAIKKARLYERIQKRIGLRESLYEASKIVTSSLKLEEILDSFAEQVGRLAGYQGKKVNSVILRLVKEDKRVLAAAYPKQVMQELRRRGWTELVVREGRNGRIGIVSRAILTGKTQVVGNVFLDPDYLELHAETKSEIAIPIISDGKVVAVLGIESTDYDAFDEEDQHAFEALAAQAGIAIHNARQYQDLEQTRAILAFRTAVACLATDRQAWQHKINGDISTIENYVKVLYHDLDTQAPLAKVKERLAHIEQVIAKTRQKRVAPPLSPAEGIKLIAVNDLMEQWLKEFYWDPEWRASVPYELNLDPQCSVKIKINSFWLKMALDNLGNNAIEAMATSPVKRLVISTVLMDNRVGIAISDSGPGIAPEIRSRLFQERIKKSEGDKGEGIGLLLSRMIIQMYEGDIYVVSSTPAGTTLMVWLPVESAPENQIITA